MDTVPVNPQRQHDPSGAPRVQMLQAMVPVAVNLISSQLEAFASRLTQALFKVADQNVRPDEATSSFQTYQLLKRNHSSFYRLAASHLNSALSKEIGVMNTRKRLGEQGNLQDMSLVPFEEMENKILTSNLCKSLELNNADQLVGLNIRIGHVLRRTPIAVSQNPFRPEIFVHAVLDAWQEFDSNSKDSLPLILRLLQPEIFLQLNPVYQGLNDAFVERGIVVDIEGAKRQTKKRMVFTRREDLEASDPYLEHKLRNIFSDQNARKENASLPGFSGAESWGGSGDGMETITIDRQFFDYLTSIQRNAGTPDGVASGMHLREISRHRQSELTHIDQNTIELLARIFDYVFNDPHIPAEIKNLIGQLQIPTLKVALMDKDFFFRDSHPARVLIDTLAKSSVLLGSDASAEDPLYQMIEGVVERVQQEFDLQIDLFSDVVADLENFLREEEKQATTAISEPVQEALKQEKMRLAREFAENDVAIRVETGEVAGFLEEFLRTQWIRILTIAHNVKEEKPNALENALKTMDDLIWSLKPKNSAEERKELVSKLPAMLTLLNAWLNAIKWDEPERVIFFSKLAERHAAIARAPLELSPRRQLEIAVNIAQRASEKRLNRQAQDHVPKESDEWETMVDALESGVWVDFTNQADVTTRYRLAWISPKRTRYIFSSRQGHDSFSVSADELTEKFRCGEAVKVAAHSVVDRALVEALRDPPL